MFLIKDAAIIAPELINGLNGLLSSSKINALNLAPDGSLPMCLLTVSIPLSLNATA